MLTEVCTGLRVCLFLTLGLVQLRDRVPYSVDSQPKMVPVTDTTRYSRGEIWWFENRDDIALMSNKIRVCQLNAVNETRFTRRIGCFIQRNKLRARRLLTSAVKSATKTTVRNYVSLRDALAGPGGFRTLFAAGDFFGYAMH